MERMKVLICDDDPLFAERIEKAAAPFFAAKGIKADIRVCTSAAEAEAVPELEQYQLAFLDVDLDGASGIALGRKLKQKNPGVMLVYISAYLEFAPQGYTVSAFRYILKDSLRQTLPVCLNDIYNELFTRRKALVVEVNRETIRVPYDTIYSLESVGRRVQVFGQTPREPLCVYYGKLADLPAEMFASGFLRVGRSAVVNMRYVRKILGYKVQMANGVELSVSRALYGEIRSTYLEWRGRFGDG